jgi:putative transposase
VDRIAPSERIENEIEQLLIEGIGDPDRLAQVGRLGAQLILQRAVEEEVTAFLHRARYERSPVATGSRNGARPKRIQTAEGQLTIAMPQVRGTVEPFVSRVLPHVRKAVRTRPLEALIIGAYVRGLSDRDIESLMDEAGLGHVSKTKASEICKELRARYRAFCAKSLEKTELLALLLDAIYLPTRPNGNKEGVLVVWGYTTDGDRVLLSVRLGQRESHLDWLDLGRDLAKRGLGAPRLVISDGAPGLIRAIEELWPTADRQRCTVHRLRNVIAKLPKRPGLHQRVKAAYWSALDEAAEPETAERALRALVGDLEHDYPSAAACLAEDLPALCVHLRCIPRLRKRFRSSNLLERSLEEVRRRTKVIGRFPGETSCLSLCWAVMDLVIAGGHGLGLTTAERQRVENVWEQRHGPVEPVGQIGDHEAPDDAQDDRPQAPAAPHARVAVGVAP